jgi:prefoldin subunit 1
MFAATRLKEPQVFQEISQKKAFAEQQLLIVRQQKVARTREGRMLQLTSSEVSSLPPDTKVYEGVGKMYALNPTRDREAKRCPSKHP